MDIATFMRRVLAPKFTKLSVIDEETNTPDQRLANTRFRKARRSLTNFAREKRDRRCELVSNITAAALPSNNL
jgi:hypothetical protein